MKPLIDPINTSDGKFHGRNKETGELATIVTPEFMNDDQDATRSLQREVLAVLAEADIKPEEATDNQLLSALKKILITADDERVLDAVPGTRKVNGHPLTGDINVTSQDIFNTQAIDIGDAQNLNAEGYKTPGLYFQRSNAQAETGANYPEPIAGSLEVIKHAGITQIYRVYNNSRHYIRTFYNGVWSADWAKVYDSTNKPSAADVDAVSAKNGGTFEKTVTFSQGLTSKGRIAWGDYTYAVGDKSYNAMVNVTDKGGKTRWAFGPYQGGWGIYSYNSDGSYKADNLKIDFSSGQATFSNVVQAAYGGPFSLAGQYGSAAPFYNRFDTSGAVAEYHPALKQLASITGKASAAFSMGTLTENGTLTWRLHAVDSAGKQINHVWDFNGNYTLPGQVIPNNYTNFDARYQAKGNYTPTGAAYTKAESDARYVQNAKLGAEVFFDKTNDLSTWTFKAPAGCVMTGFNARYTGSNSAHNIGGIYYKPQQILINGAWRTISG